MIYVVKMLNFMSVIKLFLVVFFLHLIFILIVWFEFDYNFVTEEWLFTLSGWQGNKKGKKGSESDLWRFPKENTLKAK